MQREETDGQKDRWAYVCVHMLIMTWSSSLVWQFFQALSWGLSLKRGMVGQTGRGHCWHSQWPPVLPADTNQQSSEAIGAPHTLAGFSLHYDFSPSFLSPQVSAEGSKEKVPLGPENQSPSSRVDF